MEEQLDRLEEQIHDGYELKIGFEGRFKRHVLLFLIFCLWLKYINNEKPGSADSVRDAALGHVSVDPR